MSNLMDVLPELLSRIWCSSGNLLLGRQVCQRLNRDLAGALGGSLEVKDNLLLKEYVELNVGLIRPELHNCRLHTRDWAGLEAAQDWVVFVGLGLLGRLQHLSIDGLPRPMQTREVRTMLARQLLNLTCLETLDLK